MVSLEQLYSDDWFSKDTPGTQYPPPPLVEFVLVQLYERLIWDDPLVLNIMFDFYKFSVGLGVVPCFFRTPYFYSEKSPLLKFS